MEGHIVLVVVFQALHHRIPVQPGLALTDFRECAERYFSCFLQEGGCDFALVVGDLSRACLVGNPNHVITACMGGNCRRVGPQETAWTHKTCRPFPVLVWLKANLRIVSYPAGILEIRLGTLGKILGPRPFSHTFAEEFARSQHLASSPGLPASFIRHRCRKAWDEALDSVYIVTEYGRSQDSSLTP